jgi:hypothetical protein
MGTQKNNTQLNEDAGAIFNQTDPKSIKGVDILAYLSNLMASFSNKVDDIALFGVKQHNALKSYLSGELTVSNGRLGINRLAGVGAATDASIHWMTPVSLLFEIPTWNSAVKPIGAIVRYDNSAYLNAIEENEANPLGEGYIAVNVPMGYYGEPWQANSVYKQGLVVSVEMDGRKVLISNQNEGLMVTGVDVAALKTEWNEGKWAFVSELEPSAPVLITENTTMLNSDCGRKFYVGPTDHNITLIENLKAGWFAKFTSISDTKRFRFITTGKIVSVGDAVFLKAKGTADVVAYVDGEFNITGNLE